MPSRHLWLPPALEKPRVRLYALGHGLSVIGTWVQATALSWLVFRLTGSIFMLGVMGFLLQIPFLLLGPFTGRIVDRMPKLKLLIGIDIALSSLAFTSAVMAWLDVRNVWLYLAAAVLHGSLNAFEMPTRQSLLATIVEDRALMPSALGVSATLFNGGRMVGPAIAGLALHYFSEGWCFLFNALSNLAIIAALLAMKIPAEDTSTQRRRVDHVLRQLGQRDVAAVGRRRVAGARHRSVRHVVPRRGARRYLACRCARVPRWFDCDPDHERLDHHSLRTGRAAAAGQTTRVARVLHPNARR